MSIEDTETDYTESFMIVPMWPIQSWDPKSLRMLVDVPRALTSHQTALQMPGMRQPLLSYSPGGKKLLSITLPLHCARFFSGFI